MSAIPIRHDGNDPEPFDYAPPVISPEMKARSRAEWDAMPPEMTAREHARAHLAGMASERRAELDREWGA